jgi:hypothetical protein
MKTNRKWKQIETESKLKWKQTIKNKLKLKTNWNWKQIENGNKLKLKTNWNWKQTEIEKKLKLKTELWNYESAFHLPGIWRFGL